MAEMFNFEHPKNMANFFTLQDTRKLVTTDIFVRLEDDTLPPKNAIPRLIELMEKNPKAGITTAISTYRSPQISKQGIGVHMEVQRNDVRCIRKLTFPPGLSGVYEALSCGFFCTAYRYKAFLEGFKNIENGKEFVAVIGCDVPFNHNIHLAGYKILADFDYWCGHMQETASGHYTFTKEHAMQSLYVYNDKTGYYGYHIISPYKVPKRKVE